MTKEQAAIDKIYQMEEDIAYIKQYVQLIDNNLKLLNNKLAKISDALESQPIPQAPTKITATPGTPPPPQKRKESERLVLGKIKTFGYIVNKSKQPIPDVDIQVYDEDNEIVKRRKTDRDGYWEVRLPPGKYGVEYRQEGYRPINRTILLDRTMKSFEVK
jgi:hypothetical protein